MEAGQQRKAGRRFWEEVPVTTEAAPLSLSPPVSQQQHQRHSNSRSSSRDRSSSTDRAARAPAAMSRVEASAVPGADGLGTDGEAKQGSSELTKLAFTVEEGM